MRGWVLTSADVRSLFARPDSHSRGALRASLVRQAATLISILPVSPPAFALTGHYGVGLDESVSCILIGASPRRPFDMTSRFALTRGPPSARQNPGPAQHYRLASHPRQPRRLPNLVQPRPLHRQPLLPADNPVTVTVTVTVTNPSVYIP